jgi:hypothetical protein
LPVPRPRYANPRGLAEETCRRLRWFWPPDPTAGFEQLAHRRRVARRGSAPTGRVRPRRPTRSRCGAARPGPIHERTARGAPSPAGAGPRRVARRRRAPWSWLQQHAEAAAGHAQARPADERQVGDVRQQHGERVAQGVDVRTSLRSSRRRRRCRWRRAARSSAPTCTGPGVPRRSGRPAPAPAAAARWPCAARPRRGVLRGHARERRSGRPRRIHGSWPCRTSSYA